MLTSNSVARRCHAGTLLALSCAVALASARTSAATFTDATAAAGITGGNGSWSAAWGDYDGDGDLDLVTIAHLIAVTGGRVQLWRNNGNGTFTDVSAAAGIPNDTGDSHGVVFADLDNDGFPEIHIVNGSTKTDPFNFNRLYYNNGNGTFTEIGESAGVIGVNHRGRGAYAVDHDGDGRLDLFSTGFDRSRSDLGNQLLRNNGDLTFTDVAPGLGLSLDNQDNRPAGWADFNGDGRPDVMLGAVCTLLQNNGTAFQNVTAAAGIAASNECGSVAGGDYDGDGDPDLFLGRGYLNDARSLLYRNNGNGTFTDVTTASGIDMVGVVRGADWGDYDNDGDLDLFFNALSNRTVSDRLYRNDGDGSFTDVSAEAGVRGTTRGLGADGMFVDYNGDGHLDLFTTNGEGNSRGPYMLLRNNGNGNHWLSLRLVGTTSDPDALFTRVEVQLPDGSRLYTNLPASHFLGQNSEPLHIGLGPNNVVPTLIIAWPNGEVQTLSNVSADQALLLLEP